MKATKIFHSPRIIVSDLVTVEGVEGHTYDEIVRFAAACVEGDEKGIERYWDWHIEPTIDSNVVVVALHKC